MEKKKTKKKKKKKSRNHGKSFKITQFAPKHLKTP